MKTKNTLWIKILITGFILSISACTKHDPEPQTKGCVVSLVGDKDGFGMGIPDGGTLTLTGGTSLPLDHRSTGDPRFTDLYPADMATTASPSHLIKYTHEFTPFSASIDHAVLHLNTLGIQDGDNQVYGLSTDIKLFLDNQEVPNAFDFVDQFDFINGAWSDFASLVDIEIPANLLYVLKDGKVEVRWELYSSGVNSNSSDAFAIDYSELEICDTK